MSEPYPEYDRVHPGDDFVSHPFNHVFLVTLGLIAAHSLFVDHMVSVFSFVYLMYTTHQQTKEYAEASWREVPAANVAQSEVYGYLTLGLARWISLLLFSASVCKLIYKHFLLSFANLSHQLISRTTVAGAVGLCLVNLLFDGAELNSLGQITTDQSLFFYLYASRIMEGLRATLQGMFAPHTMAIKTWNLCAIMYVYTVYFMLPRNGTHRTAPIKKNAHMFKLSLLVFVQNVQDVQSYGLNCYSIFDMALQLCIILKTWKHFWGKCLALFFTIRLPSSQNWITFLIRVKVLAVPVCLCSRALSKCMGQRPSVPHLLIATLGKFKMNLSIAARWLIDGIIIQNIYSAIASLLTTLYSCLIDLLKKLVRFIKFIVFCACAALKVTLSWFCTAVMREWEIQWAGNVYQDEQPNWERNQVVIHPPRINEQIPCVPCSRLERRMLDVRRRNTLKIPSSGEPESVLQEAENSDISDFLLPVTEELVAGVVEDVALCTFEVVPQQATQ